MRWLLVLLVACGHPAAPPAHGRVVTATHHSAALGVDKRYVVYLPAGYDREPTTRWPVFYYLHGVTSPETEWVSDGHLDAAADALALAAIVVMPDADDSFYIDSAWPIDHAACLRDGAGLFDPGADRAATCVHARAYESYIVKELIPHVDATYRTIARKDGRAIAGVSMGGFGAWSLALRHQELFAAAASHSGVLALGYAGPHPYVAGKVAIADDVAAFLDPRKPLADWVRHTFGPDWRAHDPASLVATLAPGALALYMDCGTDDHFQFADHARYVHDLLAAHHVDHVMFLGPGKHDYDFWVPRVPASLAFLRDHTAKPERR